MQDRGFSGHPFHITPFDGERDGHAYGEEESGEDHVGQSHEILVVSGVFQIMRNIVYGPEVIHEDHHAHRDGPEDVDGDISLRKVYLSVLHIYLFV